MGQDKSNENKKEIEENELLCLGFTSKNATWPDM